MQIKADTSREGIVDDGTIAFPERIAMAERHWPRGRLEDFEQLDRRGRRWRDKATGTVYRKVDGCGPILRRERRGAVQGRIPEQDRRP